MLINVGDGINDWVENSAKYLLTRKYPLRGYILGVLTHTTALDQL